MSSGRQMLDLGHQTPSGAQSGASSVLFSRDLLSGSLMFAETPVRRGRVLITASSSQGCPLLPEALP